MAETAASTAYGPMVLSAMEQTLPPTQRIVDDPLAYKMLPTYMQFMVRACHLKPVRQMLFGLMDKSMPGLLPAFPCRKQYIADKITEALETGFDSVVMLGAGLDTLACRIPQLAHLRVCEVDLPENIRYKRKVLERLYGAVPAHVTLIPTDFEDQGLEKALRQGGYGFDQKTFFVWEAVTQYLTEDAVRETFRVLAKAQPGSRLLFTYVLKDFIDGTNTFGLDSLYQRFVGKNQIWHFGLNPQNVADFLSAYSWQVLEDVGAEEFTSRYMKPAGRLEPMAPIERAAYAEKLPG